MLVRLLILVVAVLYDSLALLFLLPFLLLCGLSARARKYAADRSSLFSLLRVLYSDGREVVIFYCSSVGEYEQALPVMRLHETHGYRPLLFFHSRAGLHHCQKVSGHEAYMTPYDLTILWAIIWLRLRPIAFIINRHEFWPGAVSVAAWFRRSYIINYVVKQETPLIEKCVLTVCKCVFTVNEPPALSSRMLQAGDTRTDRLRERYEAHRQAIAGMRYLLHEHMPIGKKMVVVGNAYAEDIAQLRRLDDRIYDTYRFIIVPSRKGIGEVVLPGVLHTKEAVAVDWAAVRVVVSHTVGDLFEVYGCADVAWVGGGFAQGVHNCLEPAFYGIPVICGPLLGEQPETAAMLKDGRLNSFESAAELSLLLSEMVGTGRRQAPVIAQHSPTAYIFEHLYESHYPRKKLIDARA